jgi:hypothetical protein
VRLAAFFLGLALAMVPRNTLAAPFKLDPQSFQRYANSLKWEDGSKLNFQFGECRYEQLRGNYGALVDWHVYTCKGFVTISNPMGSRVCSLKVADWDTKFRKFRYVIDVCRYK